MNHYALIMAGGGGTRFWPLSRQNKPKQLLNLTGNDIMLNETIRRSSTVIPEERTFIITNENQAELMSDLLLSNFPLGNILKEPMGRNTAACILYSVMKIEKKYGDGIISVFPADHTISDEQEFHKILEKALLIAEEKDAIVTIGIEPTFPATGYGYIKRGSEEESQVYLVDRFVEKPTLSLAENYVSSKKYYWNSGMFIFKISYILEQFKKYLPEMFDKLLNIRDTFGTLEEKDWLNKVYPELESISFDYAIMEKVTEVLVISGVFGWNDVGSFDALDSVFPKDRQGNVKRAEHIGIDTSNSILYGHKKLIVTIGVSDLIVVDTEDALLVCAKNRAQEVKNVVEELKAQGKMNML